MSGGGEYYTAGHGVYHENLGCAVSEGDMSGIESVSVSDSDMLEPCGVCITQETFVADMTIIQTQGVEERVKTREVSQHFEVMYRAGDKGTAGHSCHLYRRCRLLENSNSVKEFEQGELPHMDVCKLCMAYASKRGDLE